MSASRTTWHGPPSVYGVVVGLMLAALPYIGLVDGPLVWPAILLAPCVGMVLVFAPGRARQLGTGLLASGAALPIALLSFVVVGALG